jgi:hypothetical protein
MRVGEHDRVDRLWIDWQGGPVTKPKLLEPLEEAAVDQHPVSIRFQQKLRTGNRTGSAQKSQ